MLYWYPNLLRRRDRNTAMLRRLRQKKFPMNKVRRFDAKDRENYSDPRELAKDAAADGFTCFSKYIDMPDLPLTFSCIQYWGINWTYMLILREISEQDEIVIFSLDDWGPGLDYSHYIKCIKEIPDFDIAQMAYNDNKEACYFRRSNRYSEHWNKGVSGSGQEFIIYKPSGAKWMLEKCIESFPDTAETVIFDYAYPSIKSGEVCIYHSYVSYEAVDAVEGNAINNIMSDTWYQGNWSYAKIQRCIKKHYDKGE